MAKDSERLIVPLGFDLDSGVKNAAGQIPTALKPIQDKLDKHPLSISLKFDTKNLDNLQAVKERLEKIKIQPIAPETKSAINELVRDLTALANILKKIDNYKVGQSNSATSADAVRAARIAKLEAERLKIIEQRRNVELRNQALEEKSINRAERLARSTRKVSSAYREQTTYLERLIKRMAVYASFSMVGGFVDKVREVTAQFELQRISLGAIIQDQAKAEQLFSQIKSFALQSPLTILDLTKYTKQLAAYQIETDKLFDTMKRLADISVGLGVDFQRIVLFYGQVRARGALYSSELRQATEAGIPLVEMLAKKYSQLNGELVTSADVLKMIEERQVSFEDVASIFEDMTNKGGMFYQMQEKQGNTLYGMWQKLGDAAAVMYNAIGNTSWVNSSMKATITIVRSTMVHWKQYGVVIGSLIPFLISYTIRSKNAAIAEQAGSAATARHITALQKKASELMRLYVTETKLNLVQQTRLWTMYESTKAEIRAAQSTNMLTKSWHKLRAAVLANPFTSVAAVILMVIGFINTYENKLSTLQRKLEDIDLTYDKQSIDLKKHFAELADAAKNHTDNSKKQKEALDELNRTYGEILGSENLEIENLRKMKDGYGELLDMIDLYEVKRKGEEKEAAIKEIYSSMAAGKKERLEDYLRAFGLSDTEIAGFFTRINDAIVEGVPAIKAVEDELSKLKLSVWNAETSLFDIFDFGQFKSAWYERFREFGNVLSFGGMSVKSYGEILDAETAALKANKIQTEQNVAEISKYAKQVDILDESFQSLDWSSQKALKASAKEYSKDNPKSSIIVSWDSTYDTSKASTEYERLVEETNNKISAMFGTLKSIALDEGVKTIDNFYTGMKSVADGNKDFSIIDFEGLLEKINSPKAKAAIKDIQKLYYELVPKDETVRAYNRQFLDLAATMETTGVNLQKYLMKDGDTLEKHRKKLSDEVTALLKTLMTLNYTKKNFEIFGYSTEVIEQSIQEAENSVKLLKAELAKIPDIEAIGKKKKKGSQQDNRLQLLQEEISVVGKLYKEYQSLNKVMTDSDTESAMNRLYGKTLGDLAKKFGITLPKDVGSYQAALKKLRAEMVKQMATVKDANKKRSYQKALIELDYTIEKADIDEVSRKAQEFIKELANKVSQAKVAKEFYDKVLDMTGDTKLADRIAKNFYGGTGEDVSKKIVEQIKEVFKSKSNAVKIDLSEAIDFKTNTVNYTKLLDVYNKYSEYLIEDNRETAKKIAEDGVKASADQYTSWLKDLETAKTFSDKRIELARYTANKIAEINASSLSQTDKDNLTSKYLEREAKEASKLEYEAFKDSPMYVALFDDLDNASTRMLKNMKAKLIELKSQWKDLDPTQLKELQSRLNDIEKQLASRNPFKTLIEGIRNLRKERQKYGSQKQIEQDLINKTDKYNQAIQDEEDAITARNKAQDEYNKAKSQYGADSEEVDAAKEKLILAEDTVNQAGKLVDKTKQEADAAEDVVNQRKKIKDLIKDGLDNITQYLTLFGDIASSIASISETFGADEEDVQYWNDIADALNEITGGIEDIVKAAESGNIMGVISGAVSAVPKLISGFANLFSASRVRKANKEIKRQQKILDSLEYTYNRLTAAAEKLFGADWLSNFKQQRDALEAQLAAYEKQLEAEQSKGKKADEDKITDYMEKVRDIKDEIADLEGEVASQMLGSDASKLWQDFAEAAWDAYKEFGSITTAIKDKWIETLQDMAVNSVLTKTMEKAMQPVYDMIDQMDESDFYSQEFWQNLTQKAMESSEAASSGANTVLKFLESAGLSMKDTSSSLTGISRDIAEASEESINGLAAGINTQNFYISQIHSNVAMIAQQITSGNQISGINTTDLIALQNQHLSYLPTIAANTAEIVNRCERAAIAAESVSNLLSNVIKQKGGNTNYVVFSKYVS